MISAMDESTGTFAQSSRRTLAAIVFTDVANSSTLMGQNEEHTLELMRRDFAMITKMCEAHSGRVLKSTGDGLLMYFDSAVQAVACALQVQQTVADRAKALAPQDVLLHRIGIHLGDVFVTDSDVMGDGVNIASRLQSEAEPGGICVSQTVYDVVKNRLAVRAIYLGPRELKNIKEAVPVYQIFLDAAGGAGVVSKAAPIRRKAQAPGAWPWLGVGLMATVLLLAVVMGYMAIWGPWSKTPQVSVYQQATSQPTIIVQAGPSGAMTQPIIIVTNPGGATLTTSPGGQAPTQTADVVEKGPPKAQIDAARLAYLSKYDFAGMLTWLEKNDLKDSELYQRYAKLKDLFSLVKVNVSLASRPEPLVAEMAAAQGAQRYELYNNDEGQLVVRAPEGDRRMEFVEISPALMNAVISAALKRMPGGAQSNLTRYEAARIFTEECRSVGLLPR